MSITKISVDTESTIKHYTCSPTDELSTYPINCGKYSSMTVLNDTTNKMIAFLIFDGNKWNYSNREFSFEDYINHEILDLGKIAYTLDGDNEPVVICELDADNKPFRSYEFVINPDISQVETAVIVGTITEAGDATVTITSVEFETPVTVSVAVELDDTATIVAGKIRDELSEIEAITDIFAVSGTGENVVLIRKITTYNDYTLNIAVADDTCVGLTEITTSTDTTNSTVNRIVTIKNVPTRCKVNFEILINSTCDIDFMGDFTYEADSEVAGKIHFFEAYTRNGGENWSVRHIFNS